MTLNAKRLTTLPELARRRRKFAVGEFIGFIDDEPWYICTNVTGPLLTLAVPLSEMHLEAEIARGENPS